jgi:hypothetical protein
MSLVMETVQWLRSFSACRGCGTSAARTSGRSTPLRNTISGSISRSCAMRRTSSLPLYASHAPAKRYVARLARL